MRESAKGLLGIFACAVLWSTSGLFIKLIDWHPMVIAGGRSFIAALLIMGLRGLNRRRVKDPRPKSAKGPLWLGAISYALTMTLFVIANKLTASANVILLQYSAPIFAALLGWLLAGERPRGEHWLAMALVMLGMWLFFKDGLTSGGLKGDLLAVLSGLAFGAYSVFMRMQKNGRPEDSMLLSHWLTAGIALPFVFIAPPSVSVSSISALLALGLFQIGLASILFAYGIRRISAVQAMLTATAEPVLNPIWVLLFTGEFPSTAALSGGALIVAAVTASSLISVKRGNR